MTHLTPDPDALAQAIRIVDGNHDLGAGTTKRALSRVFGDPRLRALTTFRSVPTKGAARHYA